MINSTGSYDSSGECFHVSFPPGIQNGIENSGPLLHKRWKVAVFAVILGHPQKILLVQKRETGCWTLPGGRVKQGENIETALVREVSEEVGVKILFGPIVAVLERIDQRQLCLYFRACTKDPSKYFKPLSGKEIGKVQYFGREKLPLKLAPQARRLFEQFKPPLQGALWLPDFSSGSRKSSLSPEHTPAENRRGRSSTTPTLKMKVTV